MPFIRYANGDRGLIRAESCICGLPYPVFELEGRDVYLIRLPNGAEVHFFTLMGSFHRRAHLIQQYQIIREGDWKFRVRISLLGNPKRLEFDHLLLELQKILGSGAELALEISESLFRLGEKQIPYRSLVQN